MGHQQQVVNSSAQVTGGSTSFPLVFESGSHPSMTWHSTVDMGAIAGGSLHQWGEAGTVHRAETATVEGLAPARFSFGDRALAATTGRVFARGCRRRRWPAG